MLLTRLRCGFAALRAQEQTSGQKEILSLLDSFIRIDKSRQREQNEFNKIRNLEDLDDFYGIK